MGRTETSSPLRALSVWSDSAPYRIVGLLAVGSLPRAIDGSGRDLSPPVRLKQKRTRSRSKAGSNNRWTSLKRRTCATLYTPLPKKLFQPIFTLFTTAIQTLPARYRIEDCILNKLPNFHGCFVCGDSNPAGLSVRFFTDGESVSTSFTPGPPQMGYQGITHGGILAALLDETMGWAPALANRRFCVTVEITVQYRKPLPMGTEVSVRGWIISDSRRVWHTEGEIVGLDGAVYAKATGRYMALSDEKTRDILEYLTFDEGCVPPSSVARL
jgi:uncharacterized protein (TIGR00369 family)